MSFVFKQDGVNSLVLEVKGAANAVNSGLTSIKEASDGIANHSGWQGNKATAVKDYVANVHGVIIASLGLLMKDLYDQAMLYQDGYYAIDGDAHAVIPEIELTDLKTRINRTAPIFDGLSTEAERIVRSVAHIGTVSYAGIQGFPEGIEALADKLSSLCSDINSHEADYQGRFEAERTMISSIKAMLAEARGYSLESFSTGTLAKSESYRNLAVAYQALAKVVQNNADAVEHAEGSFQETYKVLEAEYQERVEKAKKAKFWTGLITAAASAVVIAATGGAGIALVAAVGAAAGAINAGVGSYYDQQIGTVGYPGTVNGWEVAGTSLFGGIVGAATSVVSAGFGNAASNLTATGGKLVLEKMGLEGLKTVTTGMIQRAGDACFDSIVAGKSFTEIMSDTASSAFDLKQMGADFAGGCAGSVVTQYAEAKMKDVERQLFSGESLGGKVRANSDIIIKADSPYLHQGYNILFDTAKETGKGIVKRGTSTFVLTGGDMAAVQESAFNVDAMLSDASTTFASSTASAATADVKIMREQHKINEVQRHVDEDTLYYNDGQKNGKGNAEEIERRGFSRTKQGVPDFSGTDACAGETEIRQNMSSKSDYVNAFNQMVEEGKIDPNEYSLNRNAKGEATGGVTRRETVMVDGKPTVVEKSYTVHHVQYDVDSGMGKFQLVETDAHQGLNHKGGDSQLSDAYKKYDLGGKIESYNNAVVSVNEQLDPKTKVDGKLFNTSNGVKAVRTGGKAGGKVTTNQPGTDDFSVSFNYDLNYQFLGAQGE